MPELDRRDFLKLVGVSAGGAAASGCSDHVEKLIPYVVQPEEITPGIAVHYASTCRECSAGCGLHVRTREGRPVKLEGNPEHPVNRGTLCARGQAGIGRTYHPDRFRGPMLRGADGSLEPIAWDAAAELLAGKLTAAGSKARVLGGPAGPTLDALLDRWVAAVGVGGRVVYEPFAYEALRQGAQAVFGAQGRPVFDLSGSDYVIDFGADAMESWLSPPEHQRQIMEARSVETAEGRAARFVYVGPRLSMTASNADEWLPARPGSEGLLALALARVAFETRRAAGQPVGGDADLLRRVLAKFAPKAVEERTGVPAQTIRRIGEAIARARRPAALPPGEGLASRRAVATTSAVLLLNAVVGAVGETVLLGPEPGGRGPDPYSEVTRLIRAMNAGQVAVLLIHDANPVYSLPPAGGFAEALEKVGFVVSFASLPDETSERADLILPDHTALESWGDAAPRAGVRSIVQPTIRPLYDTQALGDTLLQTARAMGQQTAAQLPEGSFRGVLEAAWSDTDWRAALARGGVWSEATAGRGATVSSGVAAIRFEEPKIGGDGEHVLVTHPSPLLYDGRGANLPWLQETPDPVSKLAWSSWVEVSRTTAKALGVERGDVVALETAAGRLEVPVYPRGGIRDDVVALAVGQGHTVGRYASHANEDRPGEARGANAIALLPAATDEKGGRAWLTTRVRLTPTGAHERLPEVQRSDNQRGRQIAEAVPLAALAGEAHGDPGEGHGESHEIRRPFDPSGDSADDSAYRWGMSFDLDRCSGCSACVVACSIENNVPNVGEDGVRRGRQMQWIRIDRYVGEGEPELLTGRQRPDDRESLGDTDVRHAPMMCQQCGAAPCESVCPVFATYHNDEGLNAMVYNRCIGTRYCANNCPYKVRRYNWFDYGIHNWPDPMPLMLNPDVTVRGQGVMEKCTFCIQRIQDARQTAKDEGRPVADGEVTPACAQSCPSEAITFGNQKDQASATVKLVREQQARAYHALHVLNTRPGVFYLAKVDRSAHGAEATPAVHGGSPPKGHAGEESHG
jgi:molybdopterin-containing oxidoreductase family iron-sulfur binding subunit